MAVTPVSCWKELLLLTKVTVSALVVHGTQFGNHSYASVQFCWRCTCCPVNWLSCLVKNGNADWIGIGLRFIHAWNNNTELYAGSTMSLRGIEAHFFVKSTMQNDFLSMAWVRYTQYVLCSKSGVCILVCCSKSVTNACRWIFPEGQLILQN